MLNAVCRKTTKCRNYSQKCNVLRNQSSFVESKYAVWSYIEWSCSCIWFLCVNNYTRVFLVFVIDVLSLCVLYQYTMAVFWRNNKGIKTNCTNWTHTEHCSLVSSLVHNKWTPGIARVLTSETRSQMPQEYCCMHACGFCDLVFKYTKIDCICSH